MRLARLWVLERERASAAERKVIAARSALREVEGMVEGAESALSAAQDRARTSDTIVALSDASARCETLRIGVLTCRDALERARAELAAREQELVATRIAERRIELLIEQARRLEARRAQRMERQVADEHAARGRAGRWTTRD